MKSRSICLSVSRRNEDLEDIIDEYADLWVILPVGHQQEK